MAQIIRVCSRWVLCSALGSLFAYINPQLMSSQDLGSEVTF